MSCNPTSLCLDLEIEQETELSILSIGMGQDSVSLVCKLVFDPAFRKKYAPNRLLLVMADTGNEADLTTEYMHNVFVPFCKKHNLEFVFIEKNMGFHSEAWKDLESQWARNSTIGSVAYPKTCTHNLKLNPQFRYVEHWIEENYGYPASQKRGYKEFAKFHGQISWMVGIAKGEEKRVAKVKEETGWRKIAVNTVYPLIDLGMDRKACQDYIRECGLEVPYPSNCLMCPFSAGNGIELLWMQQNYPNRFDEWVAIEQRKLEHWADKTAKNIGVSGKLHKEGERKGEAVTLKDLLALAKEEFQHLTKPQLAEYRFSHGHCVVSAY